MAKVIVSSETWAIYRITEYAAAYSEQASVPQDVLDRVAKAEVEFMECQSLLRKAYMTGEVINA